MSGSIEYVDVWEDSEESVMYEMRPSTSSSSNGSDESADGGMIYMRERRRACEELPGPAAGSMAQTGLEENPMSIKSSQNQEPGSDKDSMREQTNNSSTWSSRVDPETGKDSNLREDLEAPLCRHGHKFFSKELSTCRKAYLKLIFRATILVLLLTWITLPIYWGSLSAPANLTGNLEAWLINRDQARIGDALEAAIVDFPSSGSGALSWRVINGTHFPDDGSVSQAVVEERTWVAVVVTANATNNLTLARNAGDTTYDPSSAITVYYAQARNEVATSTYLLPLVSSFLTNFTTSYATSSAQRYFAAIVSNNGTVNVTALEGIAQAPQTISPGIGFRVVNLRPYTTPEAQAVLLVGQIYICIFAFIVVMAHSAARGLIASYLTLPSYLVLRIVTPLAIYLPLSLSYALVSLAFKLPFGAKFNYGRGFMAFFGFVYLGMAALGLALEAMITLMGPRFIPLFLVLLIIVNVSTAALPPELQPRLYAYGSGFQFWNVQQALRTILFNTYSHLPKNAGILIAWVLISCVTTSLFTFGMRWSEVRRLNRENRNREAFDSEYGGGGKTNIKWKGKGRGLDEGEVEVCERKRKGKKNALGRWHRMMIHTNGSSDPTKQMQTPIRNQDRAGDEDLDEIENKTQKRSSSQLEAVPSGS